MNLYILFSIFPLIISFFVYVFYRTNHTLVNIFLTNLLDIKNNFLPIIELDSFLVYSLPGGLWVFSSTIIAFQIKKHIYYYIPILFVISLELLQFFKLTDGTFDLADITSYLIFFLFSIFCNSLISCSISKKTAYLQLCSYFILIFLSDVA